MQRLRGQPGQRVEQRGAAVRVQMHRRLVQQQQRREAARLGRAARRGRARRRSAAPSAGRCWPARPARPVAASASAMSARCAPSGGDPAAASRARAAARPARSQSSTASAGAAARRSAIGQSSATRRPGTAPASAAGQRRVQARHQRRAGGRGGDGVARHGVLQRRPARRGRRGPAASRRLRLAIAVSCAATSRAWPGSSAQTSRSRKRRRPDAPSWNSRSICGVSQTAATRSASSAWLRGAAPSRRNTRRSAGPSGRRAGADVAGALRRVEAPGDRPGAGRAVAAPREVGQPRAAQAAAGHQQGDGFQQVGLARCRSARTAR